MERIGLILKVGRDGNAILRNQIRLWTGELLGDVELVDIGPPPTGDPPPETSTPSTNTNATDFKFLIYDTDHPIPLSTLRETWKLGATPAIAITHDASQSHPQHLKLATADDTLLTPLDRLLFLQKVEFLVAGAGSVTPSFLFQTKIDDPRVSLELGKSVHLTQISETGCTVISPRPIAVGVEGTLICSLLGPPDSPLRQIEIRVQDSVPYFDANLAASTSRPTHERPPEYEVRLRFFGLRLAQLKHLRAWLAKNIPGGLPEIKRSDNPPKNKMRVALITPRANSQSELRSSLEQLTAIDATVFSGFKKFTSDLLARQSTESKPVSNRSAIAHDESFIGPKRPEDVVPLLPRTTVKVRLHFDDLYVERIEPQLNRDESVLGASLDVWEKDASPLTKGLGANDKEVFDELLSWVASGIGPQWKTHEAEFEGLYQVNPYIQGTIKAKLKLVSPREGVRSPVIDVELELKSQASSSSVKGPSQYEAILVDASLLQGANLPDFEARNRILSLTTACDAYKLVNAFGNSTPIVVFNASDSMPEKIFRGTRVRQVLHDFSDRRYHAEVFINLSRPELWSSPGLTVQGLQTDVEAALFRPAKISAISEAGFSIVDKIPFKPGSALQVLSSLWPQQAVPLWAKVRRTSEANDGLYQEDFIFLAVNDEIQKSIRNFTRADYVQKKKAE